jgi:hypothetical protein
LSSVSRQPGAGGGGVRAAVSRSALRVQSDRRLVALTRAGSSAAFSVIVERYREPLLGYTRRLVGPDEADDVLQQTFVNALGALRRDGRRGLPRGPARRRRHGGQGGQGGGDPAGTRSCAVRHGNLAQVSS